MMPPGRRLGVMLLAAACVMLLGGWGVEAGRSNKDLLRVDESFDDSTYVHMDARGADSPEVLENLMDALRQKMNILSAEDLVAAVNAAVEKTGVPRALLLRALYVSGQWGTLDALEKIKGWLVDERRRAIYRGYEASLGDIIHYLFAKKCSFNDVGEYMVEDDDTAAVNKCEDCVMLLDDVTLARDRYHQFHLAIPYGWVGGLTLFNQMRYRDVIMGLAERLVSAMGMSDRVNQCLAVDLPRAEDDCVVEVAFALHPGVQKLEREGMTWTWISREVGHPEHPYDSDEIIEEIRSLYDHTNRVNVKVLLKADTETTGCRWFKHTGNDDEGVLRPKVFRKYDYLQYLMEYGTLVSLNNLASYAEAAYGVILERFPPGAVIHRRTRKDLDTTTLWCAPELYKSSNIVYHILMMNTDADPRTLFYCPEDTTDEAWARIAAHVNKRVANVMVMDDLAVSGTQLKDYYHFLRQVGRKTMGAHKVHPRVVPLLYTESAKRLFKTTMPRVKAFAGRLIRDGGIGTWMIKSGWSPSPYDLKGFSSVALPYMAPDNSIFFAYNVAKAFTFKECGIKKWFCPQDMKEWPKDAKGRIILAPKCKDQEEMARMGKDDPYSEIAMCWRRGFNYHLTKTIGETPKGEEYVSGYDVTCTVGAGGDPGDPNNALFLGGFGDDYNLFND